MWPQAVVGGGGNSFGDEGAVRPVDSLRDRDQALVLRLIDLVDIRQKAFHVKIHLGKVDEIRAVAHPGSQSSRAGQPAGVASHDLQNGNGSVVVHMGVPLDLHAGGSDVPGCGAEARAVVGAVEVIVNGLGHADDAARIAHGLHVLGDFVACVHGVVAAVVEEIAHIILAENFPENTAVVGVILAGLSQLVAAGAQGRGGGCISSGPAQRGPPEPCRTACPPAHP